MAKTPKSNTMTDAEAADEAILLLTRKMRRLHRAEFDHVWGMLPDGAKRAIYAAEARADRVRDAGGKQWADDPFEDDSDEE